MKLKISDLLTLEQYDKQRDFIRKDVIAHKKNRTLSIGDNIVLIFEDFYTIKYQVQEMLRIEKIFKDSEIQEEINAYNPLIPDGNNFKATMLIMFPNVDERKIMLSKLHNIENKLWVSFGNEKIFAHADEDLDRSTEDKTSAVHFLRFQLNQEQIKGFLSNQNIEFGVDHPGYRKKVKLNSYVRSNLVGDLSSN
tara:strand:- start:7948 stop:8529 length:582 start_codon:yes stop_codon:yes gene_type:complete